jgi:hypothetical protein
VVGGSRKLSFSRVRHPNARSHMLPQPPLHPLLWLDDDTLGQVLVHLDIFSAVKLSEISHSFCRRLAAPIAAIRASLPPPFTPEALDKALASNDLEAATPLLEEAMRRYVGKYRPSPASFQPCHRRCETPADFFLSVVHFVHQARSEHWQDMR